MNEILNKWRASLKLVDDSPRANAFNIQTEETTQIYESYNSFPPIYDLKDFNDIKTKLVDYREFFSIIQALRRILRDERILSQQAGQDLKFENIRLCEEVFASLKEDISFLRAQILSVRQENVMKDQIKLMKDQMKLAKTTLNISIVSLAVAIVIGLIVAVPIVKTWLGL